MALFRSCFVCAVFALCVQFSSKAYPTGDLSIKLKLNDDTPDTFSLDGCAPDCGSEKYELPEYASQAMAKTSEDVAKQDNSSTAPKMSSNGINNIYIIGSINATEVNMGQSLLMATTANCSSTKKPKKCDQDKRDKDDIKQPVLCPNRHHSSPRPSTCSTNQPTQSSTRPTCTTRRTECTTTRTECPTTCPTTTTTTTTTTAACPKKRHPEYFDKFVGISTTQQPSYKIKSQDRTNVESIDKNSQVDCHCASRRSGDSHQHTLPDQTFV